MRKLFLVSGMVFLSLAVNGISPTSTPHSLKTEAKPPAAIAQRLSLENLPIDFIPNAGQTDKRVGFTVKGNDRTMHFTPEGMTVSLFRERNVERPPRNENTTGPRERRSAPRESWVVKMDFVGARKDVVPQGLEKSGTVFSYFKGGRQDWRTGLPGYRRIIYRDLWPGVLVFKGDAGHLKYEFIVDPGANPGLIQLDIRGASNVQVDNEGRLVLRTPVESIIDEKPLVYQEGKAGERKTVAAAYKLRKTAGAGWQVAFSLADYDRRLPLVIDPMTLVYCGYIGGSLGDNGYGIAVDNAGNAYVTGWTQSNQTSFRVAVGPDSTFGGGSDAFVAKVNASGTGLYTAAISARALLWTV